MYAVKRQFRIWGHEISEAWGRISFYGRVILGAVVSVSLALIMVRTVIQPLNAEISALSKNLTVPENLDPEKDEQIIMHRDRAARLKDSLKSWNERLDSLKKETVFLRPEVHLEVIRALQAIYDRCGITLVSEALEVPAVKNAKSKKGSKKNEVEVPKGPLRTFTHNYEIRGNFRQMQAMMLLAEELPWRFEIRDIALRPSELMPNELQMNFTLDIHYLAE